jgi:pimeloyl-ACP methyl ester carboxylesterase
LSKRIPLLVSALLALSGSAFSAPKKTPASNPLEKLRVEASIGESAVVNLKKGAERRFVFANEKNPAPTERAVVYLHGFSASPREAEPLAERLAEHWKANLYFPRYTGHGIEGSEGLRGVKLEDWQRDTGEALAIGRKLGKNLVVIAMSTAAPLAAHDGDGARSDPALLGALIQRSPGNGNQIKAGRIAKLEAPHDTRFWIRS